MGPNNQNPNRGEPENSGEAFQHDMDDLYGKPDTEENKEPQEADKPRE